MTEGQYSDVLVLHLRLLSSVLSKAMSTGGVIVLKTGIYSK